MTTKASAKSRVRTVVTVALVTILAVVAILVMRDAQARNAAQTAYDQLDTILRGTEPGPTDEEVHQLIGRKPDEAHAGEGKTWVEQYRWRGVLRDHTLTVHYSVAAARLMNNIELD